MAAIMDQDVGMGVLTGAISGALFFGAGEIIAVADPLLEGLATITKAGIEAGIHAAAGAASGAVNSAITGGDIGQGALVAGLSAGAAEFVGAYALPKAPFYNDIGRLGQEAAQSGSRAALGTLAGGITAEITRRDFGEGAITGAWTAAYGYAFNRMMHEVLQDWSKEQWEELDNFREANPGFPPLREDVSQFIDKYTSVRIEGPDEAWRMIGAGGAICGAGGYLLKAGHPVPMAVGIGMELGGAATALMGITRLQVRFGE